eukprot:UN18032
MACNYCKIKFCRNNVELMQSSDLRSSWKFRSHISRCYLLK